jgi:ATP-dependent DNA helicase RecG
MAVMVETQDGFRIAEEDLKLRGPGEFLGTRQSGMPELVFGDLINDSALMEEARQAAFELVESDPNLRQPDNEALRRAVEETRFGFELINVS